MSENYGSYRQLATQGDDSQRTARYANEGQNEEYSSRSTSQEHQAREASPQRDRLDFVQFSTPNWFVNESAGKATIHVMRLGSLHGRCSVTYRTYDGSAEAGERYVHASGTLLFDEGMPEHHIDIAIISSDAFDTSLTFNIKLENAQNCQFEERLKDIPIYILDDDTFPTDKYADVIKNGSRDDLDEAGIGLLFEFAKYTFTHVPTIWWKTSLILFLDQLSNAYYLASILMRVYLVDVILDVREESTNDRLIIPGDRDMTAIILALAWFTPNVLLLAIDVLVATGLDMGYTLRKHLRVNLFRKMLNYNSESRREVPIQDMTDALGGVIPDVVQNGYIGLFEMAKHTGKIAVVIVFLLMHHPASAVGCVIFPAAIFLQFRLRHHKSLQLQEDAAEGEDVSTGLVASSAMGIELIGIYEQKNSCVSRYEDCLKGQRSLTMELKMFEFWSDQLVPWLTLIAMGSYMMFGSLGVLSGGSTVGTLLATLNVFKDLGDRFGGVYDRLNDAKNAIKPLLDLTKMLNFPTNLADKQSTETMRLDACLGRLKKEAHLNWNTVPITFSEMTFNHIPSIQLIDATIEQGSITLIHGPQGCGKAHLVKAIADLSQPDKGCVLFAPHQSCLFVTFAPQLMPDLSVLENLRFGATAHNGDPARVRRIFRSAGISENHWLMKLFDKDVKGEEDDSPIPWHVRASHIEQKLIHIARAFVFHPQIMVLHKPVDDVDQSIAKAILALLTEFVKHGHHAAKVKTVFMTTGLADVPETLQDWADYKWDLGMSPARLTYPTYDVCQQNRTKSIDQLGGKIKSASDLEQKPNSFFRGQPQDISSEKTAGRNRSCFDCA